MGESVWSPQSPEPFSQHGGEARILHTKEWCLLLTSPRTQVRKLRHRGPWVGLFLHRLGGLRQRRDGELADFCTTEGIACPDHGSCTVLPAFAMPLLAPLGLESLCFHALAPP